MIPLRMQSMGSPAGFEYESRLGELSRFSFAFRPGVRSEDLEIFYGDHRSVTVVHRDEGVIVRGYLSGWAQDGDAVVFRGFQAPPLSHIVDAWGDASARLREALLKL